MITEEFVRLVTEFERDCPDWTWLARNDEVQGYFVNLRPNYAHRDPHGFSSASYGLTAEAAFIAALFKVSQYLDGRGLRSMPEPPPHQVERHGVKFPGVPVANRVDE